jgi:hypothetical protein
MVCGVASLTGKCPAQQPETANRKQLVFAKLWRSRCGLLSKFYVLVGNGARISGNKYE